LPALPTGTCTSTARLPSIPPATNQAPDASAASTGPVDKPQHVAGSGTGVVETTRFVTASI
jgi:hypothetical protein